MPLRSGALPRVWDSPLQLGHRNPFEPIDPRKKRHAEKEARAKRVMGAITNATRYACNSDDGFCPEGFVTSRKLGDSIPLPDGLGVIRDLLSRDIDTPIFKFAKYGRRASSRPTTPTPRRSR